MTVKINFDNNDPMQAFIGKAFKRAKKGCSGKILSGLAVHLLEMHNCNPTNMTDEEAITMLEALSRVSGTPSPASFNPSTGQTENKEKKPKKIRQSKAVNTTPVIQTAPVQTQLKTVPSQKTVPAPALPTQTIPKQETPTQAEATVDDPFKSDAEIPDPNFPWRTADGGIKELSYAEIDMLTEEQVEQYGIERLNYYDDHPEKRPKMTLN